MPRFSEEDAQRIFARAAERQHAADDVPPGFSLGELQEIGQAAGLSPEHIAAAVAEVRGAAEPVEARTAWGIETDVRRSRVLPTKITDEAWEAMVSRLRQTFKVPGVAADVGASREWTGTNGAGGLSNLRVVAKPVEGGTRVTLETSKTDEVRQAKAVPWLFAFAILIFPVLGAFTGKLADPAIWILPALFAAMGVAMAWGMRRGYRTWSETRQGEFDALLDQFDLIARDATPQAAAQTSAVEHPPALGLDALGTAPDGEADATRRRDRA